MSDPSDGSGGSGLPSGYDMHVSAMHDMAHREGLNQSFPPAQWDGSRTRIIAYFLWLFVGWMGGHRLYLGRWRSALLMLAAGLATSMATSFTSRWAAGPMVIWWLVDAVLIPGWVHKANVANDARRASADPT